MEKERLLELIKPHSDKEAIGMILSNYTDYGHTEKGGMISVGQFYEVADVLIEWWAGKNEPSEKEVLPLNVVVPMLHLIAKTLDDAIENVDTDNEAECGNISDVVELLTGIANDNSIFLRNSHA